MCKKSLVFFLGKGLQFLLITLVLTLMAIIPALAADNDHVGATDPMSPARRSLFKDNEAFLFQGRNWEQKAKYYAMKPTTDDTLENWDIADTEESINDAVQGCNGDIRPVAAASGRLESHKHDSAVSAYFDMEQPGGAVNVAVMNQGRTGRIATWKGSNCGYGGRSVDLAVADLDGYTRTVKDDNGNDIQVYSDEIVVVYTETYNDVRVYKVNVLELAPDGTLNSLWWDSGWFGHDIKYVAAVTGDFDGDLKNEFAIAVSGDDGDTNIISYKITLDEDQNRVFTKTGRMTLNTAGVGLDMTAGDFDGDGADELFLVMREKPILYYVMKFEPDPDNNTQRWVLHDHKVLDGNGKHRALIGELRVASGLFKLDPKNGFGFNKRQVMVVYASGNSDAFYHDYMNNVRAYILDIGDLDNVKTLNYHHFARCYEGHPTSHRHVDVTVGNFIGHGHDGEATSPVEQAMISFQWWVMMDAYPIAAAISTCHTVAIFDPGSTCEISMPLDCDVDGQGCEHDKDRSKYNYRSALAAPDSDGDTWVLGPPAHAMVPQYLSMDYLILEPPKQVDYLPVDSTNWNPGTENWGNPWEINNISGYAQFYTSLESSKTGSLETTATETSSWDIGASASFTFEEGFNIGVASASVKSTTKLSYDHKAEASHYNKNYHSETVSNGLQTNEDDMLVYRYQFLDIWRYPVFGFDYTDDQNKKLLGCYELIFPSKVCKAWGAGKTCSDWFQPLHTNGNLLSYPFGTDYTKPPPQIPPDSDDIGTYTLTMSSGTSTEQNCINDPKSKRTYSGNAIDMTIYWVDSKEEGAKRSSSNTMSESESITTSASGSFEIGSVSAESEFSFHNSNSWGKSASRKSVQTNSTGIALKIPEIPTGNPYYINTAAYYSANGTLKVIHGVIMPSTVNFWKNYYNVYPDPGLNLPFRFEYHINNPTGDWWSLETDPLKRMKARGIFIRKNQPNAVSGLYDCLGMALQDGDEVRVCARIHNYSIKKNTGLFHVRFEYVPIDASSHELDPAVNRTVIGVTADPISLDGGEMQEVHVLWDTTGLWNKYLLDNDQYATYRIYVVVDPADDVPDEIHDWKDIANAGKADWADEQGRLYHGNNEGYWPNGTGLAVLKTPDAAPFAAVDASLHDKSLSIQVSDQLLDQGNIIVRTGQTYPFRVHIKHSAPIRRFQHVLISEQHPSTSSEIIADHLIFGSEGNDAWVWGEWTPKAAGEYDLHAQVLEDHNDPIPGNAIDSLKVIVQDTASGGGGSGCFINSLMPGGGM